MHLLIHETPTLCELRYDSIHSPPTSAHLMIDSVTHLFIASFLSASFIFATSEPAPAPS